MNLSPIWRMRAAFGRRSVALFATLIVLIAANLPAPAQQPSPLEAKEKVVVALGDSLTAGLGLPAAQSFPARLEAALRAKGHKVRLVNAGVSGDTVAAGLARLDWAVPGDADLAIVAFGANDALRGVDPRQTRAALDEIIVKLKAKNVPILLAGMKAPRNLGPEYTQAFDAIYPELASKHGIVLHPFLLEGIAMVPGLNQQDGSHPNAEGVAAMVEAILPKVEMLLTIAPPRETIGIRG